MSKPILHQVTIGATVGDAITDQAFLIRRWLREKGFISEIYAEHIHPALKKEVHPAIGYQPSRNEKRVILHHSTGSSAVDRLLDMRLEFIMVYHNITPAKFFADINPALAAEMEEGRRQLLALLPRTPLALADSAYNEEDLRATGFTNTGVLSISLDENKYKIPSNPDLIAQFHNSGPLLLFVGRQVPNKKPEDLLKLLYYYRRIDPTARLLLIGDRWIPSYERWLHDLTNDLGLNGSVLFQGHVTQQDMVTYFRLADLYISMSEHEGFGKPLIESMYLDLPILAYAAAAVPYTLGNAGVLIHRKEYEAIAELVDMLVKDKHLRQTIIKGQRERIKTFLEPQVRQSLYDSLARL